MSKHEFPHLTAGFSLYLEDGKELQICGCQQVLVYEDDCILLRLKTQTIRILGHHLTLCGYFGEEIVIGGTILSIGLEVSR